MTDFNAVREEIIHISSLGEEDVSKYEDLISGAVSCVGALVKNEMDENDARIIHFCALKVYYQILLLKQNADGITSFQAGDVSYTVDHSSADKIKELMNMAFADCRSLFKKSSFAFEAV